MATWTPETKNSATWSAGTKNAATWTAESKSLFLPAGTPIGLLLAITTATGADGVQWTYETKN